MLHPQRLLVLRAVLAAGSINAAARNLNYSAATISQHMTALARETGLVLLEKQGRGIVPTAAARHLADQAAPVLADFARLERVVSDLRGGQAEPLAVACFASAAEQWMPDLIRAVREHRPNLTVEVSLNEPVDGRGRRRPDLDLRTEPADGVEVELDGYERHLLLVEELVVVLPAGHRFADQGTVALRELGDESWIDHDIYDSPIGRIVRSACTAAGFTQRHAARLDDHRAALRVVAAGMGLTVLPLLAVAELPVGLVARPLTPTVRRRVVAYVRTDRRAALIRVALDSLTRSAVRGASPARPARTAAARRSAR